jgi:hypothetical protein
MADITTRIFNLNPASPPAMGLTTPTASAFRIQEVDGHVALTLSIPQVCSSIIHNIGQGANNILHALPTAAYGYSFIAVVGETQAANKWGFTAYAGQYIYLDGTIGAAAGSVKFAAPVVGDFMTLFTFKRAADYAWICKTGYGSVTAE